MTHKELNEILYELFEDCEETQYSEGMSFHFEGFMPVFNLEIEGEDGEVFSISYRPPVYHIGDLILNHLDTELINRQITQLYARSKRIIPDDVLEEMVEDSKQFFFNQIALKTMVMVRCFEAVFRQAALDVPKLWSEIVKVHGDQTNNKIQKKFISKFNRRLKHPSFNVDFDVSEIKERFAKQHMQGGKKIFQQAFSILPKDSPPRRFLFDLVYSQLLPVWKEAQKYYKGNQTRNKWRQTLAIEFEEHSLPSDLIDRLDSLDKIEKMPSSIALVHAARLCRINEDTAFRTLQLYRKESKQWLKNANREQIEDLVVEYRLPITFHPDIITANSDEIM